MPYLRERFSAVVEQHDNVGVPHAAISGLIRLSQRPESRAPRRAGISCVLTGPPPDRRNFSGVSSAVRRPSLLNVTQHHDQLSTFDR